MMKQILIGVALTLLFGLPVSGQSKVEQIVFEQANKLYLDGEYSSAREEYLKIVNSGFESPELFYNLGNTYFKLGQIPSAILYFEKAILLDPKDPDIRFNLDLVNRLVVDKINPVNEFFIKKWIRSFAGLLRGDTWGHLSIVSIIILLSLIIVFYASKDFRFRKILLPAAVLSIAVFTISLVFGTLQNNQLTQPDTAIIFSTSLTAKSSPDPSGTDLFVIHEGVKVKILDQVGAWVRIRLADGNEAWIPEASIEKI
jgi:tetratricopeptide (TPR) repeat protein